MYYIIDVIFAFLLFVINGLLGIVQNKYKNNLFEYGCFELNDNDKGNFSGNFFLNVVNPAIYIAILSAIFAENKIVCSFWSIIPIYWILRLVFKIFIKGQFYFINWYYELVSLCISIILGEGIFYLLVIPLIKSNKSVFIPLEEFRNAVWYSIIAYFAKIIWDISKLFFDGRNIYSTTRMDNIIFKKYQYFQKKYGDDIWEYLGNYTFDTDSEQDNFKQLIYAIMIFEDYNRPWLYRRVERIVKKFVPKTKMSLGIMQVQTEKNISDKESIKLAIEKLYQYFMEDKNDPINYAIRCYNNTQNYLKNIWFILDILEKLSKIDKN